MEEVSYKQRLSLLGDIKNKARLSLGKVTPNDNASLLFCVATLIAISFFGPMLAKMIPWGIVLLTALVIMLLVYIGSAHIFKRYARWETYVYDLLAQVKPVNKDAFDELKRSDASFGYDARRVIQWCEFERAEILKAIAEKNGDTTEANARTRFMNNNQK